MHFHIPDEIFSHFMSPKVSVCQISGCKWHMLTEDIYFYEKICKISWLNGGKVCIAENKGVSI